MPVVDEAATRIREEVDEDANIIVGFTFERAWKISSASRWWRLASIILARRARRKQRTHSRNSPAGCATTAVAVPNRLSGVQRGGN
jgi:cell division protein FtsZ